ncbi:flagellin [Asaia siamensis]
MSLSINTNASAMVAIQTLNATQSSLSTAENQVSTGLKVSNASDNAAAFGIAQQMQGNISGQSAVNDGLSFAAQTVSAANTAANQILSVLNSVQNAVTSLGNNTGSPAALSQIGTQINDLLKQINTIAENATVNGVNLFSGSSTSAATPPVTSYDGIGITSNSLTYVTGLQGSTSTITNFNSSINTALTATGSGAYGTSTENKTMADVLGLVTGTASTIGTPTVVNAFVNTSGQLLDQTGAVTTSTSAVSTMISGVQAAIKAMTAVTSTLGSNTNTIKAMSTYGSSLSDNLTNGIGALTDADMSAASAKLTSLQTKQSLAIKSLTIANSQSQNILSLFQ